MANWYDTFWNSLLAIVQTTWTDVSVLAMDVSIERRDWINLIDEGQLVAPYCVVTCEEREPGQWGCAGTPNVNMHVALYYIIDLDNTAIVTGDTATAYIKRKLIAFQAALYGDQTLGTIENQTPIDATSTNPINVSMIDADRNYQGGSITFDVITNVAVTS